MAAARGKRPALLVSLALFRAPGASAFLRTGAVPAQDALATEAGASPGTLGFDAVAQTRLSANATAAGLARSPGCGVSEQVTSSSDKWIRCPAECPLFAEHKNDGLYCDFRCVSATVADCKAMNPQEPVVDLKRGICRSCLVDGCKACANDGSDTCAKCSSGYYLENGLCKSNFFYAWVGIFIVFFLLVALVAAWIVDIGLRATTNEAGLAIALDQRSRAKLRQPKAEGRSRRLWPLWTNLTKTNAAGPGLTLAFSFQVAIMIWALIVGVGWVILAWVYDEEFLMLGLHRAETTRQNCILVAFGYETQHRLIWTKVYFIFGVYIFSFVGSLVLGVRQNRLYQELDDKHTTYKDFCARCSNLPKLNGSVRLEEELQEVISKATREKVIGVSVCWDFAEKEDELIDVLDADMMERERSLASSSPSRARAAAVAETSVAAETEQRRQCWIFEQVEDKVLGSATAELVHKNDADSSARGDASARVEAEESQAVGPLLESLETTGLAFVVFKTEAARNLAVLAVEQKGGIPYRGNMIRFQKADFEPVSVVWKNCVEKDFWWRIRAFSMGVGTITVALVVWSFAFYAPYAYFVMSFNYAHGQEPGIVSGLVFTMVVVMGNVLMYFVCSEVSDRIGFQDIDAREVCYMLLYSFACVANVALDLVVTYYMAYWMMVGVGMKTYQGVPLSEVHTFTERFETYAMQRELGRNLMAYSFPSTFLVPFILEPFLTIYLPYKIMVFIVRAKPSIPQPDAEKLLMNPPMDLSRYADVLLNVMLVVLVFYFPGGFTHRLFLALAGSHVVIYALDHYKVLRCIPSCYFASDGVDWWAQWMLCIPCAFILASAVFKMNCQEGFVCLDGVHLLAMCTGAFLMHIVLHTMALLHVVPAFAKEKEPVDDVEYEEVASQHASSWFSANPMHCLRSKYIYKHDPPADFCLIGKEHLLRRNLDIGQHFEDHEAKAEDYTRTIPTLQDLKAAGEVVRKLSTGVGPDLSPPSTARGEAPASALER